MHRADRTQLTVSRLVTAPLPLVARAAVELAAETRTPIVTALPRQGITRGPFVTTRWSRPLDGGALLLEPLQILGYLPAHGVTRSTSYRSFGELRTARRRVSRVEVELLAWSRTHTEVSLRPGVRDPDRWSDARVARWFRLAHAAADDLRRALGNRALAIAVESAAVDVSDFARPDVLAG